MRNIPTTGLAPLPVIVPERLDRLARDLSLVLAYRSWTCHWERLPAPLPSAERFRIASLQRVRQQVLVVDLMRRADVRSSWSDIRDQVRRSRGEAATRGEEYFLMTERALTPVLRSNLERLLAARPFHPTREVEAVVCDECPVDTPISLGILAARAARAGINARSAEAAVTWLLSMDVFRGDLMQPLGRSFRLRRLARFRRPTGPQPSLGPPRRTPPPWILPA